MQRLVGIDISEHMIEQARRPVLAERITVGSIELLVGEAYSAQLRPGTFDFIYSIGVIGEYVPIDAPMLRRLHDLLRPGGVAFFTATDARFRVSVPEDDRLSLGRRAVRKVFLALPTPVAGSASTASCRRTATRRRHAWSGCCAIRRSRSTPFPTSIAPARA
ncbi:MAG: class I SAM-dependent methyltransferase [Steroidobacteraceae bacterium]